MQVDPQAYLGWSSPQSSGDPGGSSDSGETWTQTMLHNPWIQDNGITSAPSIHPKSLDSILERHQQEILEDLNSLGRYSRYVSVKYSRTRLCKDCGRSGKDFVIYSLRL